MHDCQQKDLLKEMRADIKTLLERTAVNGVKVSIMGMISGGIGAAVVIIIKFVGG